MCPDVLARAAAGVPAVAVSGTNGKTTTTRLIATALETLGPVATNIHGANLPNGVVSALLEPHPDGTRLVAEIDERWLPAVMAQVSFRAVVLLNLSRDQIDRMAEVRSNAVRWRAALARQPAASRWWPTPTTRSSPTPCPTASTPCGWPPACAGAGTP